MSHYFKFIPALAMSCLGAISTLAQAEIILHGTRVVYPSNAREVTMQVSNNGDKPSLVQAWVDTGDAKSTPDKSNAPFMITPPIFRVEPNSSQALRIAALPATQGLSQTQESVFWLNVLDIPPKVSSTVSEAAPDNFMQLAIRSRIKLFYRPAALKDEANEAPGKLQWRLGGQNLQVKNPTPCHVSMTAVYQLKGEQKTDLLPQGLMLAPFEEKNIALANHASSQFSFIAINDYGGRVEQQVTLQK